MASTTSISSLAMFLAIILFLAFTITARTHTIEKETHLHFFFQERTKSPNVTAIKVVSGPVDIQSNQTFNFGDMMVFDDLITEGPDPTSRPLGQAEGFLTIPSLNGPYGLLALNLVFQNMDPWTGSSLTLLGRIQLLEVARELAVVGGTGQFRFARGYALQKHIFDDNVSGNSTFELELTVLHI